jgi:hypothetical protein
MTSWEYKVVINSSKPDFEEELASLLAAGWRPSGGVACIVERDMDGFAEYTYVQAMTRETRLLG